MRRLIEARLLAWKAKNQPLPLLVFGARQVGKTYTVRRFGEQHFRQVAYVNFQVDAARLAALFAPDLDPQRLVKDLELVMGARITPFDTLIIFDEVQLCQPALTALKYFAELAPEYRIIATGSLFGVTLQRDPRYSFPVGKVEVVELYPLSFEEFCWATGRDAWPDAIRDCLAERRSFIAHDDAINLYRRYLMTGGLPAAVKVFIKSGDWAEVRSIQGEISRLYAADIGLYLTGADIANTKAIWDSAPQQLARENRKFKLADVGRSARASRLEVGFSWLENAGLIHLHRQVEQPVAPLRFRGGGSFFKVYLADVGLLAQALGVRPDVYLDPTGRGNIAEAFHGGLAENYVAQALAANGLPSAYWSSGNTAEVDFLAVDNHMRVVPIEVKSGTNVRSKSLAVYIDRYHPPIAIRLSAKQFGLEGGVLSVPLYAAFTLNSSTIEV